MTDPQKPRIALISATAGAIPPAVSGLAAEFGNAEVWNILDDKLLADADAQGGLTEQLAARMSNLIEHAIAEGADGVLLTCSMYGVVATAATAGIPILAPDEAAFEAALEGGFDHILIIASFESALRDSVERFTEAATEAGASPMIEGVVAAAAFEASQRNDTTALLEALAEACRPFAGQIDAVLLAQYTLAPVAEELSTEIGIPVIAGPQTAAAKLRAAIEGTR